MSFIRYPAAPDDPRRLKEQWNQLVDQLQKRDRASFFGTASPQKYDVTLVSATYSLNPTTANTSAVAHVLATVIMNLKNKGILS